jgi:putative transposase
MPEELLKSVLNAELKLKKTSMSECMIALSVTTKLTPDVAAGQNIRNRGIIAISTVGQTGRETACAADLLGAGDNSTPRQVAKSRKRKTRKTQL